MKFAIIGGDLRLAKLAEFLLLDGHRVSVYALDKVNFSKDILQASSVADAAEGADCVVLPLPVSLSDGFLNAPLSSDAHSIEKVLSQIPRETLLCGGLFRAPIVEECARLGVHAEDYFLREELIVTNAEATAEGALQILMEETPVTICGSRCLVVGYGRIGKLLARMLKALGAQVTVSARKAADEAWIHAEGYGFLHTYRLSGELSAFDIVVNTVPARIFSGQDLQELSNCRLYLDLASRPGGLDFSAASRAGVKTVWAHSLPGEVAPESCAAAIRDAVQNIIKEQVKNKCPKE